MGVTERRMREKRIRRLEIMDAAKRVFAAKGFTGATMEEIAEKAELSPATLYNYFKNKYDLYASLNLRMLNRLVELMDDLKSRRDLDSLEKIGRFGEAMYDLYEFDPFILRNVIHLQASDLLKDLSPEVTAEINNLAARSVRTMAAIFAQAMEEGIIEEANPIALGDIVWGLFTGLVIWEENKRSYNSRKEYLKPTLLLASRILAKGLVKGAACENESDADSAAKASPDGPVS
jgi:AcrR family transcriptional regulator